MSIDLKNKNMLSPIVLIAFNRINHFKQTLDALIKNKEAKNSMLYVCIDGPRNTKDKRSHDQMCNHVEIIRTHFLNIKIINKILTLDLLNI